MGKIPVKEARKDCLCCSGQPYFWCPDLPSNRAGFRQSAGLQDVVAGGVAMATLQQ